MNIKEKITYTFASITDELQQIAPDFYVIGASVLILSGIEIGGTSDIDILTIEAKALPLQQLLKRKMEIDPKTKEDDLFCSDFARFLSGQLA